MKDKESSYFELNTGEGIYHSQNISTTMLSFRADARLVAESELKIM